MTITSVPVAEEVNVLVFVLPTEPAPDNVTLELPATELLAKLAEPTSHGHETDAFRTCVRGAAAIPPPVGRALARVTP